MKTNICPNCNQSFIVNPKKPQQQYCSRECFRQSRLRQVDCQCETCGKTFQVYQARASSRFCSWECYAAKVEKICVYCGTPFYVKRSAAPKRETCSRSCHAKYKAAQGRSPHQGKPRPPETRTRVSEGLRKYYSGQPEKHWNFKGGGFSEKRGNHTQWQARRLEARQRANFRCEICAIFEADYGKQLSVHHIHPFRYFASAEQANTLDNLICTCQSCHMKLEHGKISLPSR